MLLATLVVSHLEDYSLDLSSCLQPIHTNQRQALNCFKLNSCPHNGRITINWKSDLDDNTHAKVVVDLKPARKVRHRGWARLRVHGGTNVYRAYCLFLEETPTLIIFRVPDTSRFLSGVPDNTPLGDITLPGTHESCALYGFPVSQCQQPSTPIMQQLLDGVRFLDVRLRVVGDELLMYHGPRPQRSDLSALLSVLHLFLSTHPTETVLLSLKEESPPFHPHFSSLVYEAFRPHLDHWFLEERVPTLGEVRGKGMLLTRFDPQGDKEWVEGMGIHPYTWPDSRRDGFEWWCKEIRIRTQDWYRVQTFLEIPEKFETIIKSLTPTISPKESPSSFTLSFASASYFPLSLPTIIAKGFGWPEWGLGVEGINSRLVGWLLRRIVEGERVKACCAMDFYRQPGGKDGDLGLAELLVVMNFLD